MWSPRQAMRCVAKRAALSRCAVLTGLALLLSGCPPPPGDGPSASDTPADADAGNSGDARGGDQSTGGNAGDGSTGIPVSGCPPPPGDEPSASDTPPDAGAGNSGDASGGDQPTGGNAGDGSVGNPERLRVFGTRLGPPHYELRWTYASDAEPQSFTVYESDAALPAADPAKAVAAEAGSARAAALQITPGTGERHMRVGAQTNGTSEVLSEEYVVDTTLRLAFVVVGREHCDGRAVYVATPDGGGQPVCISGPTPAKSDAQWTVWSPDGRFVATVGDYETAGEFQVHVATPDGTSFTPVSGTLPGAMDVNQIVNALAWSPDATQLAYAVFIPDTAPESLDCLVDLYVVAPDTASPTLVGHRARPTFDGGPYWSPDSERLAYIADPNETDVFELYVAPADGSAAPTKLSGALVAGGNVQGQPAWSPDGQWLAFVADMDVVGQMELYVVPAAGGVEPTKLSGPMVPGAPGLELSYPPLWSPDGTQVAYGAVAETTDIHHSAYYVVAMPPGNPPVKINLDVCGAPARPQWSPDGTRLAILCSTWPACVGYSTYVVSPGQEPVLVSGTADVILDAWSPDSTRVAFSTNVGIYVALADGSSSEPLKVSGTTLPPGRFQGPVFWSVDGTRLAFLKDIDLHNGTHLWVVPADGSSEPVDVTGSAVGEDTRVLEVAVAWSRLSN